MITSVPHLPRLRWQTLLIFLCASAAYFLTRTPALDEWDSVQFAQGVGDFNLWRHHPHPPGYPLYILAGWLGSHALPLDVPTALQLASALGGGLFVACWFVLTARRFGRLAAWALALSLGTLLVTWMSATKAITDPLATGFLALTLLLADGTPASDSPPSPTRSRLRWAALAGAAAVGVRPQNVAVVLLILVLACWTPRRAPPPPRAFFHWQPLGIFLAGCLGWLVPTMWTQTLLPESHGDWLAYPRQLLTQWRWRLDQPKAFIGAETHGESFLRYRLDHHLLGLFTRGFGFPLSSFWGWLGLGVLVLGWIFYALTRGRSDPSSTPSLPRCFWPTHLAWAALYVAIVFCCLPGDQRYYLPVFPLLLLPALLGWRDFFPGRPARLLPFILPLTTFLCTLPFIAENHREPAPPVRMLRYLQAQYPPAERPRVRLLLRDSFRHAQWYAPEFQLMNLAANGSLKLPPSPPPLVYTDDPATAKAMPGDWQIVASFERSPLIYRKHNEVTLYRLVPVNR